MDTRKIEFLIAMQREIDKAEAREGASSTRVERLKSRFYDVVEVEEVVKAGNQVKQDISKAAEPSVSSTLGNVDTKSKMRTYTPEEVEENVKKMAKLKIGVPRWENTVVNSSSKDSIIEENRPTEKSTDTQNRTGNSEFLHKPKDVAAFLIRFRERKNRGLKYLTHRWSDMKRDQPLTYEEVIENAKKEFQECIDSYTIPEMLKSKVREFVRTKSWSGKNRKGYPVTHPRFFYSVVNNGEIDRVIVDSGWSSDEMIEWAKDHPGSDPNQDNYWKDKLINPFKKAIEVRDGMFEEYLRMNAEAVLKDKYLLFSPIYSESVKEARFFTDVPILFEGIRQLLESAKEKAQLPALRFDYFIPDSDDLYGIRQIKIITDKNPQIGSLMTKNSLIKGGNFGEAYDHFYGLCNWSILCQRGGCIPNCRIVLLRCFYIRPPLHNQTVQSVSGVAPNHRSSSTFVNPARVAPLTYSSVGQTA